MASYLLNATRLARFFVLIGGLAITAQAGGQTNSTPNPAPTQKATTQSKLTVSSNQPWTDAQVDVHLGDVVQIRARSGKGDYSSDGNNNGSKQSLPVSTALAGALIGKIDNGTPFPVGATQTLNIGQQGRLSFGMNGSGKPPCNGDIEVELQITAAPLPELKLSNTALDPGLAKDLDSVPRRVNDQFKNLGDMVNFVIVGPQQELQAALSAAHWQLADQSTSVQTFLGSRNTGVKRNGLPARVSPRTELPGALVLGSRREFDRGEWKQFQDGLLLLRPVGSVAIS